ncbi:MAG: ComF family protein [Acidobacteria bacterium]|nr:ComF family protein [Acidobacteriota bacterium]
MSSPLPPSSSLRADWLDGLLSLFYPDRCLLCDRFVASRKMCSVCEACWSKVRPQEEGCSRCGLPLQVPEGAAWQCQDCRSGSFTFSVARSFAVYENPFRDIIHCFKFRGRRNLAAPLACRLQSVYEREPALASDVVVPLPLHRRRLRERGYNQSLLLAKPLARRLDLALEPDGLKRIRSTVPQSGLLMEARRDNIRGAFVVPRPARLRGKTILLVDDVFTTGATLNEAARTLLESGAGEVKSLTLARAIRAAY